MFDLFWTASLAVESALTCAVLDVDCTIFNIYKTGTFVFYVGYTMKIKKFSSDSCIGETLIITVKVI